MVSVCARNKSSTKPRSSLLRPLPAPSRPWSHGPGLPPSQSNTAMLTAIDRFSTVSHFPTLHQLPADLLVIYVFRLHGLLSAVVSDRGPQFGRLSALPWEPRPASLLDIIPKLMAKLSGPIRRRRLRSTASLLPTHPPGAPNCHGWKMPKPALLPRDLEVCPRPPYSVLPPEPRIRLATAPLRHPVSHPAKSMAPF